MRYERRLLDLPLRGRVVHLRIGSAQGLSESRGYTNGRIIALLAGCYRIFSKW